jgi:hypothetical protein
MRPYKNASIISCRLLRKWYKGSFLVPARLRNKALAAVTVNKFIAITEAASKGN